MVSMVVWRPTVGSWAHISTDFSIPLKSRRCLDHIGFEAVAVGDCHGPLAREKAYDKLAQHAGEYLDIKAITDLLPSRAPIMRLA